MSDTPTPETLAERGALDAIDKHFAETVARITGHDEPLARLGAAVASHAVGQGHVCADLAAIADDTPIDPNGEPFGFEWPPVDEWVEAVRAAPYVSETPGPVPLILDAQRLYLARYYRHETTLARWLSARGATVDPSVDQTKLTDGLQRMFPDADGREKAQAQAARAAVERKLAIISGGPGTGKTRTVTRVLALLLEQAGGKLAIDLLAPTGKAAQRLGEAIAETVATLPVADDIRDAIPREAATIHRRLGVRFDDATRFNHDRDNPLHADVVLVDEASMVDLALMARLVDAVPPESRLILLGDRDQLASVEAGAIFGDVCRAGADGGPLAACAVHLTERFRFKEGGAIGKLADAIGTGDAAAAWAALNAPPATQAPEQASDRETAPLFAAATEAAADPTSRVRCVAPAESGSPIGPIADEIVEGYRALLQATTPEKALEAVNTYRVLCAHRSGRAGVQRIGDDIEALLGKANLIATRRYAGPDDWYTGRLVMVTQNDYQLDLFNGDVGVTLPAPGEPDRLRVWFPTAEGLRDVQPARLPPHETCFAMTIHKSQGSEFGGVAIVLPSKPSPIGTRELLYTAVTRARNTATIVASQDVVRAAIDRRIIRASGLVERL